MKKLIFCMTAVTLFFAACKKDDDGHNNGASTGLTLTDVYSSLEVKSKLLNLNATTGGSFYGNSGTRYIFPANAFVTSTGSAVNGNVQVEVKEYLNRADMIFSRVLPLSNNAPLNSGGEIYVHVTQNGQPLSMANGKYFTANVPQGGTPVPGMGLFYGIPSSTPASTVNWNMVTLDSTQMGGGVIYNGDTISIISDSIGYCNIDQFITNPNYQTFTVTIAGVTIASNQTVLAYTLYDNYNGMWPMYGVSGNVITESHVPDIPVHFVVMTIDNGVFYGGIAAATPTTGNNYTVTLSPVTPTAFAAQVAAL